MVRGGVCVCVCVRTHMCGMCVRCVCVCVCVCVCARAHMCGMCVRCVCVCVCDVVKWGDTVLSRLTFTILACAPAPKSTGQCVVRPSGETYLIKDGRQGAELQCAMRLECRSGHHQAVAGPYLHTIPQMIFTVCTCDIHSVYM